MSAPLFGHGDYRASTGDAENFDILSAAQFQLLTSLGLREYHFVLDVGCGPMTAGRLLIPYLLPGRYFAIEPEQRLIEEGVRFELGHDQLTLKKPRFLTLPDFRLSQFGVKFDYILAHSLFSHAAVPQVETCLQEAAGCLRKDGVFAATWMLGPQNYAGPEWSGPRRVQYSEARMREMVHAAGLQSKVLYWPHPAGETWMICSLPGAVVPEDPGVRLQPLSIHHVSELEVVAGEHRGFVESVLDVGEAYVIGGWAMNPETRRGATHVLFADGEGRIAASARVESLRPDVAAVHGQPALRSGFQARIRKSDLRDISSVSCLSFTLGDTKAFAYLDWQPYISKSDPPRA